ncbi:hypothetical protein [Persephonella sp.]
MLKRLIVIGVSMSILLSVSSAENTKPEMEEIQKEIKRLEKLRSEIRSLLDEKRKILKDIEEKEKALKEKENKIKELAKKVEEDRYKKLAKVFEKMDPEMAGEKISKMSDPKKAAYIIYNMKERLAGEVMNYVDPIMVDKITKILTDLRKVKKVVE